MLTTITKPEMNKNVVCLQKGFVSIPSSTESNLALASTVQSKLMYYGYMLGPEAFNILKTAKSDDIIEFHNNVIDYLANMMGGALAYAPLYGDFPVEVMSEEDAFVMMQALSFYTAAGDFTGFVSTMVKPVKFENVKYTILKPGTEEDIDNIFTQLVSLNTSLTPLDRMIVEWFATSGRTLVMPDYIPFKETLCTLAVLGLDVPVRSEMDVLRIAVGMSGGDVSLPALPPKVKMIKSLYKHSTARPIPVINTDRDTFKFKKFSRKERKYLLGLLEKTSPDPRRMVIKSNRWIRLGEVLHPGEYGKKFPQSNFCFLALRRGPKGTRSSKPRSVYFKIIEAFGKGLAEGLNLLVQMPGEFVRRLDWIIRNCENIVEVAEVVNKFKTAAPYASNKVIFELYNHFSGRNKPNTSRYVMIKGARKKTKLPDLPAIDQSTIDIIKDALKDSLTYKFSKLPKLGKVWIDPELKKIPLPSNMRSLDLSLKPTIRGQRNPIGNPEAKVVRAFFHWFDKDGTRDPDLSATFVGMGKLETLSYSSSHLRVGKSQHSGDIIARKGACAEYIDIEIEDAKARGHQYVVMDVRNFRGGSLAEMDGVFGYMEREHPNSNTSWLPDTIAGCQKCSSSASNTLLAIIDLHTMEYIFLDVDSSGTTHARGDVDSILEVIKQYAILPEFSVYDLLQLHVDARGENAKVDIAGVSQKMLADTTFEFDDFSTSYQKISEFMGI